MSAVVEIKCRIERFTYKPGYHFTVEDTDAEGACAVVRVDMDVPDSAGGDSHVWGACLVPQGLSEDEFWIWLRDIVIDYIENHEADEWFRIDGKQFRPPHLPGAERPWGIL